MYDPCPESGLISICWKVEREFSDKLKIEYAAGSQTRKKDGGVLLVDYPPTKNRIQWMLLTVQPKGHQRISK